MSCFHWKKIVLLSSKRYMHTEWLTKDTSGMFIGLMLTKKTCRRGQILCKINWSIDGIKNVTLLLPLLNFCERLIIL